MHMLRGITYSAIVILGCPDRQYSEAIYNGIMQDFAVDPQTIFDVLTSDTVFMDEIGQYEFESGGVNIDAISILTPGQKIPLVKDCTGLECIIHDVADIDSVTYLTNANDTIVKWKVFLVLWDPADGMTMTRAAQRVLNRFIGASAIETVATSSGIGARAQTMITIRSNSPIVPV